MYEIRPLLTGVRNPDQGVMTYQHNYGRKIWLPIWAFLVRGQGRNILIDTGLCEDELMIPPGFTEETGLTPKSLPEWLEELGLRCVDIDTVVNTHLHDDHCGNNELFPEAQFFAHEIELEFCANPHPLDHRYEPAFIEGQEFTRITGDMELAPGLEVRFAPGHTPGCLAVRVETSEGSVAVTGFCCNEDNFPKQGPAICPGVHTNAIQAWDSIQSIKDAADIILPMHSMKLPERIGKLDS